MKHYRKNGAEKFGTVSLTMDTRIIQAIALKTRDSADQNSSRIVEEAVMQSGIEWEPGRKNRREYKAFLLKKTFTFSSEFISVLEAVGNKSFFVELALAKVFEIELN